MSKKRVKKRKPEYAVEHSRFGRKRSKPLVRRSAWTLYAQLRGKEKYNQWFFPRHIPTMNRITRAIRGAFAK